MMLSSKYHAVSSPGIATRTRLFTLLLASTLFLACSPDATRTSNQTPSVGGPILLSVVPSIAEGAEETIIAPENASSVTFTLTLSQTLDSDLKVYYTTIDGTATLRSKDYSVSGTDATKKDGVIVIPKSSPLGSFSISIKNDTYYEGDEEFVLGIQTDQTTRVSVAQPRLAQKGYTIRIQDDDPYPTVQFEVTENPIAVSEGIAQKSLKMLVAPWPATDRYDIKIPVTYVISSATAGEDFIETKDIIIPLYASDNTESTLPPDVFYTLLINDDVVTENTESVTVVLGQPTGAILGANASITFNIVDDDSGVNLKPSVLNDTGINRCVSTSTSGLYTCPNTELPGQDGETQKAFDVNTYTSLGGGQCVRDETTGLIWEVKAAAGSGAVNRVEDEFFWYDSRSNTNGGSAGVIGSSFPCKGVTRCDTETYVAKLNEIGYCGYKTWRMPRLNELISLLKLSGDNPFLVKEAIGPTGTDLMYWSSAPLAGNSRYAWAVRFGSSATGDLRVDKLLSKEEKAQTHYVRLVTTGQ